MIYNLWIMAYVAFSTVTPGTPVQVRTYIHQEECEKQGKLFADNMPVKYWCEPFNRWKQ